MVHIINKSDLSVKKTERKIGKSRVELYLVRNWQGTGVDFMYVPENNNGTVSIRALNPGGRSIKESVMHLIFPTDEQSTVLPDRVEGNTFYAGKDNVGFMYRENGTKQLVLAGLEKVVEDPEISAPREFRLALEVLKTLVI